MPKSGQAFRWAAKGLAYVSLAPSTEHPGQRSDSHHPVPSRNTVPGAHTTHNSPVLAEYSLPFQPSLVFRFPGNHPKGLPILTAKSSDGCAFSARTASSGPDGGLPATPSQDAEQTPWVVDVPPGSGYVRLQTETELMTPEGKQVYRCFTNPIWIEAKGPGDRRLRVTYADW